MYPISEILAPENWDFTSPKDIFFSSDHVIDAYLKGKNDGLEQGQKLILDKLIININKSGKHTSDIFKFLKSKKFNPISAYLKITSWDDFTILFVLPEREFIDKKIISIYDYISDFETKVAEDLYYLQIIICDSTDKIDEDYIKSDGFVLKHKM